MERIAALEKESAEKDEMISRLKKKEFGPSSEIMDDMDDSEIKIPASHLEALACVAGLRRELEKEARKAAKGSDSK